jgi:CheY-like chemotaxis protein
MNTWLQPLSIIAEDDPIARRALRRQFERLGCEILEVTNLLDVVVLVRSHLSRDHAPRVVIICLDIELPLPLALPDTVMQELLEIDSWHIAAVLSIAMHAGEIWPAHLIALSAHMTEERKRFSLQSGCIEAWPKPLRERHEQRLKDLLGLGMPSLDTLSPNDFQLVAARSFEQTAQTYALLTRTAGVFDRSLRSKLWTETDSELLLGCFTSGIRLSPEEKQQAQTLLESLGGYTAAGMLIHQCSNWLDERQFPILARCLRCMKNGATKLELESIVDGGRKKVDANLTNVYRELAVYINQQQIAHTSAAN